MSAPAKPQQQHPAAAPKKKFVPSISFHARDAADDHEARYPREIFLDPQTFVAHYHDDGQAVATVPGFVRNWGLDPKKMTSSSSSSSSILPLSDFAHSTDPADKCPCNDPNCHSTSMADELVAQVARTMAKSSLFAMYKPFEDPRAQWAKQRAQCVLRQLHECRQVEEMYAHARPVGRLGLRLRLFFHGLEAKVYRVFLVPAVMPLDLLVRQVLLLGMGFTSPSQVSLAAWCLTRGTDGACFGPDVTVPGANEVYAGQFDKLENNQTWLIPANQACANDLFRCAGSQAVELEYDFNVRYRMRLLVEEVIDYATTGDDTTAPDGSRIVSVVDGKGACPPEGAHGMGRFAEGAGHYATFYNWYEPLDKQRQQQQRQGAECKSLLREMARADNCEDGGDFDPINGFNLHACQLRVKQAVENVGGGGAAAEQRVNGRQAPYANSMPPPASLPPACLGCGRGAKKLLMCGGCKLAKYCSPECQKNAWGVAHKHECSKWKAAAAAGGKS